MTPQEQAVNEKVARKLGWRRHKRTCVVPTVGASITTVGNHWYQEGYLCRERMPDYCHSIAAAWEIVEHLTTHLKLNGISYSINLFCTDHDPKRWHFSISHLDSPMLDLPSEEADTPMMTICLAFLKLEG